MGTAPVDPTIFDLGCELDHSSPLRQDLRNMRGKVAMLRTQTIVILAEAGFVSFIAGICFGFVYG